ncbi:hypothetical protein ACIA5C_45935 [Actinoplanes sp. NPDC051343]|uniref:hypothetical protein n=1 Tax=Actinoplanes sp. NPDC051343 TaxID=3363906 RepID=UPI0037998659
MAEVVDEAGDEFGELLRLVGHEDALGHRRDLAAQLPRAGAELGIVRQVVQTVVLLLQVAQVLGDDVGILSGEPGLLDAGEAPGDGPVEVHAQVSAWLVHAQSQKPSWVTTGMSLRNRSGTSKTGAGRLTNGLSGSSTVWSCHIASSALQAALRTRKGRIAIPCRRATSWV